MHIRTPARGAVASLVLLSAVLGTAAPDAARAQSNVHRALLADAPYTPSAASASGGIGLVVQVAADGRGQFTPGDGPGADASASNGIVRTFDSVTYRVTMNADGRAVTNERFTLTAPRGTSWASLPAACSADGSAIDGALLSCNLGTIEEGQAVAVPVVLDVSDQLRNGDSIVVRAEGTADGVDSELSATSPSTIVSSAARYNLSKNVVASILRGGVTGPDGVTGGVQLVYPIAVDWQPVVAGQGLLGFERSDGALRFTDDVSQLLGDLPSGALLWNAGRPACGPNDRADELRFAGLPGGEGGGDTAVVDSGTFDCSQSGPGQPVRVEITGTVTDPARTPTRNVTGGPVSGGVKPYFVSGYVSLWVPTPPALTSVDSVNTFSQLETTSVGGQPNFPGGVEPTADNTARRNLSEFAPGTVGKWLYRVADDGRRVDQGSAKNGDPWATPDTLLRSDVGLTNNGVTALDGVVLCDTFDRRTQVLTRGAGTGTTAWTRGLGDARIQYAAYDMPSAAAGRSATCDDDDAGWVDRPEDVDGGIDAVGAVRATGRVSGGVTAGLFSFVTTRDVPDGTRALDFGHVWLGDQAARWVHDSTADPELGAGPLADSVLITENLARVEKKIVDPGSDAADTADATSAAAAGDSIDYALYPTLTNGKATGRPTGLSVQDVLPLHASFVSGSASIEPTVDAVDTGDGMHQRLTWSIDDVRPGDTIAPITYSVRVTDSAPPGSILNTVTVSSPTDRSDETWRTASRSVRIVESGGVRVEKTARDSEVVAGDLLEWDLRSTNTHASDLRDVDIIDVLPHPDDSRGSSFHGTATLAAPVRIDEAAGEAVRYTRAAPEGVDLDGAAASNRPGGSTKWCLADEFSSAGCPSGLADVTAVRIERSEPIAAGDGVQHEISLRTSGEHDGDSYVNRFGLSSGSLALPVRSNPATIRVHSGAIGDRVWTDTNGNGRQDADEPSVAGVRVRLSGTDDSGGSVARTTSTAADGRYWFDGLRPGSYVVSVTAPDGRAFTRPFVGDPATDSDVDATGVSPTVDIVRETGASGTLVGITRNDSVDAGLFPEADGTAQSSSSPASDAAAGGSGGAPGLLAFTGASTIAGVALAVVLLLVGSAGLVLRRRSIHEAD